MQKISIISGIIILVVILAAHFIFPSFTLFNCGVCASVVILSTLLLQALSLIKLKDAFRYSLNILFSIAAFVEIILGIVSKDSIENNIALFAIILLIVIEIILLLAAKSISDKSNN